MKQIETLGDERELAFCAHCGGDTDTRDHVPSRVLLDKPYPANLARVPCCRPCNESFALDEEYLAVLIDCALVGSITPSDQHREEVRTILRRRPALAARISHARRDFEGGEHSFEADRARVENVVLKLARGHALFELHSPQLDPPSSVFALPISELTTDRRDRFETPPTPSLFSEMGSRAMRRMFEHGEGVPDWIVVQDDRYRFMVSPGFPLLVRVVLSEYLACGVVWADR